MKSHTVKNTDNFPTLKIGERLVAISFFVDYEPTYESTLPEDTLKLLFAKPVSTLIKDSVSTIAYFETEGFRYQLVAEGLSLFCLASYATMKVSEKATRVKELNHLATVSMMGLNRLGLPFKNLTTHVHVGVFHDTTPGPKVAI